MKSKLSILTIYAIIFLLACIGYTFLNYKQFSEGEGWGVIFMADLFVCGLVLLILGIILQNLVENKKLENIISLVISIIATLLVIYGGFSS